MTVETARYDTKEDSLTPCLFLKCTRQESNLQPSVPKAESLAFYVVLHGQIQFDKTANYTVFSGVIGLIWLDMTWHRSMLHVAPALHRNERAGEHYDGNPGDKNRGRVEKIAATKDQIHAKEPGSD